MIKTSAFVFARGGSKGLPRKNILPLGGLPMLVHGIRLAQKLDGVDGVYVSSDCQEILSIAEDAGAETIVRPDELASDNASEWLAWQHAIKTVQARHGKFDNFLSLPPTAPLRSLEDVQKCLDALREDIDIVVTMSPSRRSPWFNMVSENIDGSIDLLIKSNPIVRRQDSPTCFDMTTVAYAAKTEFILRANRIWDGKVTGIEVPLERALDIDTPLDYAFAKFVINQSSSSEEQF